MPAGTGFRVPETPSQKWSARREHPVSETAAETNATPIWGLFACLQERSAIGRMRGGPERTRTTCRARSPIEPVSDVRPLCGNSGLCSTSFLKRCIISPTSRVVPPFFDWIAGIAHPQPASLRVNALSDEIRIFSRLIANAVVRYNK
jgi:hypothetical protein